MGKKKDKKNKKDKNVVLVSKEDREDWVHRIRLELKSHHFGLPPVTIEYANITWETALNELKLKAVQELHIRLNLYEKTGKTQHGFIDFPEANRKIEYILDRRTTKNNHVKLKAVKK